MDRNGCCGNERSAETDDGHETVRIPKTAGKCRLCDEYAERMKTRPAAVICCEGACLRGEVARQAANLLCHELAPEKSARICLGGAFTKELGQRALVRNAGRVIAVEGCPVHCASRMMRGAIPGLEPEIVLATEHYAFDRTLFGIDEMPADEIRGHARAVARKIADML
jgi:uncharacterized metal-binding protein